MIEIKLAQLDDLKDIRELNYKLFELEFNNYDDDLNINWPLEETGEAYFKDMIENNIALIAKDNKKTIGYLVGSFSKSGYTKQKLAELENMLIEENYRGCGVGNLLLNKFKYICKENDISSIKVLASLGNNLAINFYKKNGFVDKDIVLNCKI